MLSGAGVRSLSLWGWVGVRGAGRAGVWVALLWLGCFPRLGRGVVSLAGRGIGRVGWLGDRVEFGAPCCGVGVLCFAWLGRSFARVCERMKRMGVRFLSE